MRVELGLLQMELTGRPDGVRPHGFDSLLDYFESKLKEHESTNGTELNGKEIAPETDHKLQDGDKVRFGKIDTHYKSENPAEARPLPEAEEVAAVVAETSMRPADFANASPFQTKKVKKDTKGVAIIVLAIVAALAFGVALFQIYSLQPPSL